MARSYILITFKILKEKSYFLFMITEFFLYQFSHVYILKLSPPLRRIQRRIILW